MVAGRGGQDFYSPFFFFFVPREEFIGQWLTPCEGSYCRRTPAYGAGLMVIGTPEASADLRGGPRRYMEAGSGIVPA